VVTTGATLLAARAALENAGVGSVVCVAAAATPATRSAVLFDAPVQLARAS